MIFFAMSHILHGWLIMMWTISSPLVLDHDNEPRTHVGEIVHFRQAKAHLLSFSSFSYTSWWPSIQAGINARGSW
ncbi:uncharacterized protein GGS22DRAFT_158500 [Annulohypoxylon maeteangense]|uniref:uncharacterized protein n=1 Tax=Annulohypoxylon maeteangense TaxID=1927788 RepID=UPI002008BE86|nr:uncharacterized protein GGS22DRAFT_158500 [Annulohypoxylon maeteangense]KAI0886708.1 hypothetical protein GGS22DRAFT_158500 [Annulohypoxylon maeteangense]